MLWEVPAIPTAGLLTLCKSPVYTSSLSDYSFSNDNTDGQERGNRYMNILIYIHEIQNSSMYAKQLWRISKKLDKFGFPGGKWVVERQV